jgi:hypothetical protein
MAAVDSPASRRSKNATALASARALRDSQASGQRWPQVRMSPEVTDAFIFTQTRPQAQRNRTCRLLLLLPGNSVRTVKCPKFRPVTSMGFGPGRATFRASALRRAPGSWTLRELGDARLVGLERNRRFSSKPNIFREAERCRSAVVKRKTTRHGCPSSLGSAADNASAAPAPRRVAITVTVRPRRA